MLPRGLQKSKTDLKRNSCGFSSLFILFWTPIRHKNMRRALFGKMKGRFQRFRGFHPLTLTPILDFDESCFHKALNTIDPPTRPCMPLWEDICQSCNIILQSITSTLHGSHSSVMVEDVWKDSPMWGGEGKGEEFKKEGKKAEKIAGQKEKKRKTKNRVMRVKSTNIEQHLAQLILPIIHILVWHAHKAPL